MSEEIHTADPTLDDLVEQYCVACSPRRSRLYVSIGSIFIVCAFIGLFVPGWPTVSFAVPAAFLFSLSSERLFRWTLSNRYFGRALFAYYATGKTIPKHARNGLVLLIALMAGLSAYFVFRVSYPKDPGFGPATIVIVGLIGMWYVGFKLPTRS